MTTVMKNIISKSQFKPKMLEYFRFVEEKKQPLYISHNGVPVIKVLPYTEDGTAAKKKAAKMISHFDDSLEPVGEGDWEAL